MPFTFTINGVVFKHKDLEKMRVELKKLPEPEVNKSSNLNLIPRPEETITCLEKELVYINQSVNKNIKFIATENLHSCLFVIINAGENYVAVHINNSRQLKLLEQLKRFNTLERVEITIVGGYPCKESEENLDFLLTELYSCYENLSHVRTKENVNFIITSQKVIDRNQSKMTDENKRILLCNLFKNRFDWIVSNYSCFSEKFRLNYKFTKKSEDFLGEANHTGRSYKEFMEFVCLSTFGMRFYKGISLCVSIDTEQKNLEKFKLKVQESKEDYLKNNINFLFSQSGFSFVNEIFTKNNLWPCVDVSDLYFNIEDKTIQTTDSYIATHHEQTRCLYIKDPEHADTYFLSFDGDSGYKIPELSNTMLSMVKVIEEQKTKISSASENDEKNIWLQDIRKGLNEDPGFAFLIRQILTYKTNIDLNSAKIFEKKSEIPGGISKNIFLHSNILRKSEEQQNPLTLYRQAIAQYKEGLELKTRHFEQAKPLFQKAVNMLLASLKGFKEKKNTDIEQFNCLSSLASCYRDLKEYTSALAVCEKAIKIQFKLDPNNIENILKKYNGCLELSGEKPAVLYSQAEKSLENEKYIVALHKFKFVLNFYKNNLVEDENIKIKEIAKKIEKIEEKWFCRNL